MYLYQGTEICALLSYFLNHAKCEGYMYELFSITLGNDDYMCGTSQL